MSKEMIDHPDHYNSGKYEVIDVIEDWDLGFHLGNAIKYIARAEHKGKEKQDLEKAMWYIQRFIDECIDTNKVTTDYYMDDELYYSEEICDDNSYEEANKLDGKGEIRTVLSEEDIGLLYRGINGFFRATSKEGESKRSSTFKPYFDVIDRLLSEYQWRGSSKSNEKVYEEDEEKSYLKEKVIGKTNIPGKVMEGMERVVTGCQDGEILYAVKPRKTPRKDYEYTEGDKLNI